MPRRIGRPGLVGTMARTAVIAGTATAVSGSVAQRQRDRAQPHPPSEGSAPGLAAIQQPPSPVPAPDPEPAPAAATPLAELERLVSLKQQGLLTDDEFATLKARLLA